MKTIVLSVLVSIVTSVIVNHLMTNTFLEKQFQNENLFEQSNE